MSGNSRRTLCSELGVAPVNPAGLSFAGAGLRSRARPGTHTRLRRRPGTWLIFSHDRGAAAATRVQVYNRSPQDRMPYTSAYTIVYESVCPVGVSVHGWGADM